MSEPARDLAHVSAVELFTPVLEDSVRFFADLMAMEEVGRRDDSVYLHAWDDYEAFTVKLTARDRAGIGRTWLRARSPEALARRAEAIEAGRSRLPVRAGSPAEPHRTLQRGRPAAARPRPRDAHLDRGGTREGPGLGPQDDRVVPHPRDATGALILTPPRSGSGTRPRSGRRRWPSSVDVRRP